MQTTLQQSQYFFVAHNLLSFSTKTHKTLKYEGMNETLDLKYLSVTLNIIIVLPASFQSKLPEQWYISLVFLSIVQMHVYSPLFGMWKTGKRRIHGTKVRWFLVLTFLSLKVETEQNHMVQDPGSREGEAKFECFPWRDTLVPALTCVQVLIHKKFDSTHAFGWSSCFVIQSL